MPFYMNDGQLMCKFDQHPFMPLPLQSKQSMETHLTTMIGEDHTLTREPHESVKRCSLSYPGGMQHHHCQEWYPSSQLQQMLMLVQAQKQEQEQAG